MDTMKKISREIKTSDMRHSINQVNQTMAKADTKGCQDMVCLLDALLKKISARQAGISREIKRVATNV